MKVGFIGLGIMGRPMAKNLVKAGHDVVVFDFNKEAVEDLGSCGASSAENGKEVASQVEVVITMVPNSPHVRSAVLGKDGVAEGARPGLVLIDKYYDMLMLMAGSVVYVGELGSGNVAKLANQIVVAVNIAAVSEALTFAKKAGTDPELVYQAIRGGLAGSTVMDAKAPMILSRNFKPGFRIELHIKDLNNALNAAHAISSPVPLTGQMMEIMQGLKADGYEKEDHSSIVKYYEKIANTTVES